MGAGGGGSISPESNGSSAAFTTIGNTIKSSAKNVWFLIFVIISIKFILQIYFFLFYKKKNNSYFFLTGSAEKILNTKKIKNTTDFTDFFITI